MQRINNPVDSRCVLCELRRRIVSLMFSKLKIFCLFLKVGRNASVTRKINILNFPHTFLQLVQSVNKKTRKHVFSCPCEFQRSIFQVIQKKADFDRVKHQITLMTRQRTGMGLTSWPCQVRIFWYCLFWAAWFDLQESYLKPCNKNLFCDGALQYRL